MRDQPTAAASEVPTPDPEPVPASRRGRLKAWFGRAADALRPGPQVIRGMVLGALIVAVLQVVFFCQWVRPGFGMLPDLLISSLLWLVMVVLCGLISLLLLRIINGLPRFFSWRGIFVIGGTFGAAVAISPYALFWVLPFLTVALVLGGAAAAAFGGGQDRAGRGKRLLVGSLLVLSVAAMVFLVFFLAEDGSDDHLVEDWPEAVSVPPLALSDPSQPGPYRVLTLTYGSGTDKRRAEYGEGVAQRTEPVDGTPFLKESKGWKIKLRHWYWGFDFTSLPINGRVWYPEGDGPFPLVLIVHGNHAMQEYSDPGYAYLGELLASRGFIFVSVDENSLNGGLRNESDCRGWLLLRHLEEWRRWGGEEGHRFCGRVDLDRIVLIGHSRGGEAAAVAGAFNRLPFYPDDATVEFDFGFNLRGIIAIAPADGQYTPADRPTPLQDVSYLVLQGAHDADCSFFMGARQLRRVRFTGDDDQYHFKASVYSYRANHGQFNTVWGDDDFGWPAGLFLNRKPLLDGEQQRQIARVCIAAFLEAVLHGDQGYVDLFRDHRSAAAWLPADIYITRFADTGFLPVCDYEEDVNVATASLEEAAIAGDGLAVWREQHLPYRNPDNGSKRNGVVYLGWRAPEAEQPPASYSILLPDGLAADWQLAADSRLAFAIAGTDEEPPEPEDEDENEAEDEKGEEETDEVEEPTDLTVELETGDGTVARLAVSSARLIPPLLESRFTKLPDEEFAFGAAREPTLQSYELPLADFVAAAPAFEPTAVRVIRFVFDRTSEGVVILDDIGFAKDTLRYERRSVATRRTPEL